MLAGSSDEGATCAQTMRSSFRPSKDRRLRREIRFGFSCHCFLITSSRCLRFDLQCSSEGFSILTVLQVKKLQVMLRQANDQLERTMTEKQNLEDSVKAGNEETAAKVRTICSLGSDVRVDLKTLNPHFFIPVCHTQVRVDGIRIITVEKSFVWSLMGFIWVAFSYVCSFVG